MSNLMFLGGSQHSGGKRGDADQKISSTCPQNANGMGAKLRRKKAKTGRDPTKLDWWDGGRGGLNHYKNVFTWGGTKRKKKKASWEKKFRI